MNRIHRLVWSQITNTWVAVAESARGRGKGSSRKLVAAALSLATTFAQAAPVGGQITAGAGSIVKVGVNTTVTQTSQSLSLNWQSFNIDKQETVNFVQPSATAVAINRIGDTTASQIYGNLNANGQVYLINPNGILFGQGAQVNVGALVASTLDLTAASQGDTGSSSSFSGNGLGSIVNQGVINAAPGGFVALLGHTVRNQGNIAAPLGSVALGAGRAVTLTFSGNSLVKMQVDQSMLNSLAENGSLIQADGGRVLMSAGANDALLSSVVNNTGVIEARTVNNHAGSITLLAGMAAGTVHVAGTLDASAPQGGNGGFIETSAAHVKIADGVKVTTAAITGQAGTWLIDPTNFTISAGTAVLTSSGIGATTLQSNLDTTSVSITTSNTGNELGDINVNAPVIWAANKLTLTALNNININANLTASGTASLALGYGQSGNIITAAGSAISLPAGTSNFTTQQGSGAVKNYTVITTAAQLAAIASTTNYALGSDINLASAPFTKIAAFNSTFDGLGHTISNLVITGGASTGLFAEAAGATIQNVGLVNGTVIGAASTGALVGNMASTTINNSYAKNVNVSGNAGTGGLVGTIVGAGDSNINSSYTTGTVNGNGGAGVGGLVGSIAGAGGSKNISNSYATGSVDGAAATGGLVGSSASPGNISNSYATGAVSGHAAGGAGTGGLVGSLAASGNISNSYATGKVMSTGAATGGLVGSTAASGTITNSCAAGDVQGDGAGTGGLVGSSAASGNISDSYATGNVMSVAAGTGGLVGSNTSGAIIRSFASGNVNGGGAGTGGLAGSNTLGAISESFAVGNVSGSGYSIAAPPPTAPTVGASTGGLVGSNSGTIANSYAAGSVAGSAAGVGGLVGDNQNSAPGAITNSYSVGAVTSGNGATAVGDGMVLAANFGTVWKMPAAGSTYAHPVLKNLTKTLALTSGSVSKVYDGLAYAGTLPSLLASCCINNSSFMTVTSATLGQVNAGVYNIAPTVAPVNAALAAYFAVTPVTLTITPANLTLKANAVSKVYDGNLSATDTAAVTSGTLATGDTLSGGTFAFTDKNAGSANKTVTVSAVTVGDGTNNANYNVTYASNTASTITPANLSLTPTADSKAYDGTVSSAQAVGVVGKASNDVVVAVEEFNAKTVAGASAMGIKAGYTIKDSSGVDMSANYNVTTPTAVGTITKAALMVTGTTTALDKVYDGNTVAALRGGALSGVVAADVGSVTLNQVGVFANKNVAGGISVLAAETLGGSAAGNYSLIQPMAALSAAILGVTSTATPQQLAVLEVVQQVTAQFQESGRTVYQGVQPNDLVMSSTLAVASNIGASDTLVGDTFVAGVRPTTAGDNSNAKDEMTIGVNTRIKINGTGPMLKVVDGGLRLSYDERSDNK